jgi:hypothetical protein
VKVHKRAKRVDRLSGTVNQPWLPPNIAVPVDENRALTNGINRIIGESAFNGVRKTIRPSTIRH